MNADGADYIKDAVSRRRCRRAVLGRPGAFVRAKPGNWACGSLAEENPRLALARRAAAFFDAQPKTVAAVTGTNGKTSVSVFLRQIWTHL